MAMTFIKKYVLQVLDENSFAIMIIMIVLMTGLITPVVTAIYKPARRLGTYRWRAIQRKKDIADLRVLVCIHTPRNVATIINLLGASNPNKQSPICILVLHLIELTGRASSMLMVHSIRESSQSAINQTQPESDHIIKAFKNLEMKTGSISVNYFTANSPYSTMHEDICNLAEDKCATFIILPFHKQQTVDGKMAPINPAFRTLNQNVLGKAPCSVGILIDRGLSGSARSSTDQLLSHRIAVLFFGGPNDREALAYAVRMAEGPANSLSVIRFLPSEHAAYHPVMKAKHEKIAGPRKLLTLGRTEEERQKQLDDDYIGDVRMGMRNDESFIYSEMVVNNGEETLGAIRSVDDSHDLFIVGSGQGMESPLTAGLTDWSECPELGVIGDLLASSDFAVRVSVLIMQQYVGVGPLEEGM